MDNLKKWRTFVDYVDVETGEIISKKKAQQKGIYRIIKEKPKIEENEKYKIRRFIYECRKHEQLRLF